MEFEKFVSYISNIDPILKIIISCLGILTTVFGISYIREKKALVKLEKEISIKNENDFTMLVDRLDRKVSAFANYLIRRSGIKHQNQFQFLGTPISQDTSSLFDLRISHYNEEKYKICKRTLEHIFSENQIVSRSKILILLIDSGSTVYPIFHLLIQYINNKDYKNNFEKLIIFTNNIPGISELIKFGRKGTGYDAEMLFDCNVIPGLAEGKYGAILGKDSGTHLKHILQNKILKQYQDPVIVSLLTGNYISTEDGVLWRGDNHGNLKNYLVDLSTVIYVLSPLGKIFRKSKDDINRLISTSNYILPPSKKYKDLLDSEALHKSSNNSGSENPQCITLLLPDKYVKDKSVYLVTSQRPAKEHSRSRYPTKLNTYFSTIFGKIGDEFGDNLISTNFEPWNESEQAINDLLLYRDAAQAFLNYEFPHPEVREAMRDELEL